MNLEMLTPYHLLRALVEAMRELFAPVRMGDSREDAINVYPQSLPISTSADDEDEYAPYCIVRLSDGAVSGANEAENANVLLLFCVRSEALDMQGYADVLHLMQMAKQYLLEHPVVGGAFDLMPETVQWKLQQEDSHPYYIGGLTASFACPPIIRNAPPLD